MSIDFEAFADTAERLQDLAAAGAPAVRTEQHMANRVVRRVHRQRRLRNLAAGGAGLAVAGVLAAGALVGNSRYFDFIQPSEAMSPTIAVGEIVTLDKTRTPTIGDVVLVRYEVNGQKVTALFRYAGDAEHPVQNHVVAVPGECAGCKTAGENFGPMESAVQVPTGRAYLLGDNVDLARDSRSIGPLPITDILGVAVAVHAPGSADRQIARTPAHALPDSDQIDPPAPVATSATVTK